MAQLVSTHQKKETRTKVPDPHSYTLQATACLPHTKRAPACLFNLRHRKTFEASCSITRASFAIFPNLIELCSRSIIRDFTRASKGYDNKIRYCSNDLRRYIQIIIIIIIIIINI
ncbi:Similar to cc_single_3.5 [Cotesia congregata]|uniref:Similar to cc_single_3.5 n=1 Tax=Cotesia congregata TaxID=51543 RepID=A0A8J2HDW2_COTCN|nr:Similar to cc_single_3.5 [Cotesia congregata]